MADQDHDMKANKEEFTAFLHPEEYDHMKDIVVLVRDKCTQVLNCDINSVLYPFSLPCGLFFSL